MPVTTIEEAAQAITALQTTIQSLLRKDVGLIVLSPSSAPPSDCIPCDGREYDITDPLNAHLKDLAGVLGNTFGGDGVTTFRVPELRGEFLRVWDDGHRPDGLVDAGRALGSFQDWATAMPRAKFTTERNGQHNHGGSTGDENQNHSHGITHNVQSEGSGNHADRGGDIGLHRVPAILCGANDRGHVHPIPETPAHSHTILGGDPDTHPRNVALAASIRF